MTESTKQGVNAPNPLASCVSHTPSCTGEQYFSPTLLQSKFSLYLSQAEAAIVRSKKLAAILPDENSSFQLKAPQRNSLFCTFHSLGLKPYLLTNDTENHPICAFRERTQLQILYL
jgi:hypothetical protein